MNRVWIIALVCALVSVAGFAQAPSQPLSEEALAAILGDSAGSCATQPEAFSAPIEKSHCAGLPTYQFHCCRCDEGGACEPCCVCNTGQSLSACREQCRRPL